MNIMPFRDNENSLSDNNDENHVIQSLNEELKNIDYDRNIFMRIVKENPKDRAAKLKVKQLNKIYNALAKRVNFHRDPE